MTLNFPNISRVYEPRRQCVSFWGHDSAFEVAFQVDEGALQRLSPHEQHDEAETLRVFDANRAVIEHAAIAAYARQRLPYHRLSASNF